MKSCTILYSKHVGTGGVCYSKRLAIRLIATAWCLSSFVIINSYCSILISFMTSSNRVPLVNSLHDLPSKPGVHVVVNEGAATDQIFSVNF